ncbi:unnamed protein product [Gadus morhua 'NCC']
MTRSEPNSEEDLREVPKSGPTIKASILNSTNRFNISLGLFSYNAALRAGINISGGESFMGRALKPIALLILVRRGEVTAFSNTEGLSVGGRDCPWGGGSVCGGRSSTPLTTPPPLPGV